MYIRYAFDVVEHPTKIPSRVRLSSLLFLEFTDTYDFDPNALMCPNGGILSLSRSYGVASSRTLDDDLLRK